MVFIMEPLPILFVKSILEKHIGKGTYFPVQKMIILWLIELIGELVQHVVLKMFLGWYEYKRIRLAVPLIH